MLRLLLVVKNKPRISLEWLIISTISVISCKKGKNTPGVATFGGFLLLELYGLQTKT